MDPEDSLDGVPYHIGELALDATPYKPTAAEEFAAALLFGGDESGCGCVTGVYPPLDAKNQQALKDYIAEKRYRAFMLRRLEKTRASLVQTDADRFPHEAIETTILDESQDMTLQGDRVPGVQPLPPPEPIPTAAKILRNPQTLASCATVGVFAFFSPVTGGVMALLLGTTLPHHPSPPIRKKTLKVTALALTSSLLLGTLANLACNNFSPSSLIIFQKLIPSQNTSTPTHP